VSPSSRNGSWIREIEVRSWARIPDANSASAVALAGIRNENITRTARPGRVGLVALAVLLPEDVALSAATLATTGRFPELVNLSFLTRPLVAKLEALLGRRMVVHEVLVTHAVRRLAGVVVGEHEA